ncbi:hypothetical protein TSUD_130470 [Trifolium subterraneum]|nr:hypothetical protein TSUD_130470 [Trifolium subterraneum]
MKNYSESYWGKEGGFVAPFDDERQTELQRIWETVARNRKEIEDNRNTQKKEESGTSKIKEEHNENKSLAKRSKPGSSDGGDGAAINKNQKEIEDNKDTLKNGNH